MITNKIIQDESKELLAIFKNGNLRIPTSYECIKHSLKIILFYFLVTALSIVILQNQIDNFFYKSEFFITTVPFIANSIVVFIFLYQNSSWYYAIPYEFSQKSKVIYFLKNKISTYKKIYITLFIFIYGCILIINSVVIMVFGIVIFVFNLFFLIAISMDLSRFQLAAFSSAVNFATKEKVSDNNSLENRGE